MPSSSDPGPTAELVRLAGAEGELLVARVRLVVCGLLLLGPTCNLISNPRYPAFFWGFWVTVLANVSAAFFYRWSKSRSQSAIIGLLSSSFDVTFVSIALLLFMLTTSPLVAVNSKVTFEMYFLAITATSLRCDRRVVIAAGTLAVVEYGALVLYARTKWSLPSGAFAGQPEGAYDDVDQATRLVLLTAAMIVADAIVARAVRLLQLAMFDGLTGLLNRVTFDRLLENALAQARRYGKTIAVAMLDADRFKQINDTYGHAVGDTVLLRIARVLHSGVREADVLARYGGEEFVLLLPETSGRHALRKLEDLRCKIEESFAHDGETPGRVRVTVSAGVSSYPADGDDADALVRAADARLLQSKRNGRNRVTGPPAASWPND